MESITGIRFIVRPETENIKKCAELSAAFFRALVNERQLPYNRILYPYADALSLSGRPGTESTRIFGTHILLRGVTAELAQSVTESCLPPDAPAREYREFPMYDGAAMSSDLAQFLQTPAESALPSVGSFAQMLGGYVTHWRIRECARVFASFSEMAYRRAKGEIAGLQGGSLILTPSCDCRQDLLHILTQKTGLL